MSLATEVARYLPFLRRYARALSGSQAIGDMNVKATLEVLIDQPSLFRTDIPSRVALYRVFQQVINNQSAKWNRPKAAPTGVISERLSGVDQDCRQALLLTAMEGFSQADTAEILECSTRDIEAMTAAAVRQLTVQAPTTVLIIEDEPVISLDLASIVSEMGHKVVGTAATSAEAVALAKATRPGFVLVDIQLADGSSGIDAVHEILAAMDVPVIFITAYPERLLTGERPEPTFLLTKPFAPDDVKNIIGHALLLKDEAQSRAA